VPNEVLLMKRSSKFVKLRLDKSHYCRCGPEARTKALDISVVFIYHYYWKEHKTSDSEIFMACSSDKISIKPKGLYMRCPHERECRESKIMSIGSS
jgi:hypothetical protein